MRPNIRLERVVFGKVFDKGLGFFLKGMTSWVMHRFNLGTGKNQLRLL